MIVHRAVASEVAVRLQAGIGTASPHAERPRTADDALAQLCRPVRLPATSTALVPVQVVTSHDYAVYVEPTVRVHHRLD